MTVVELSRTTDWPLNRLKPFVGNILSYNNLKPVDRPDSGSWRPGAGDQSADMHAQPYLDEHPHLDERPTAQLPDEDEEKELPSLDLGDFVQPSAVEPVLYGMGQSSSSSDPNPQPVHLPSQQQQGIRKTCILEESSDGEVFDDKG